MFALDPAIEEELVRLRAETVSKTATIHSQADEINELYAELDRYRMYVVLHKISLPTK